MHWAIFYMQIIHFFNRKYAMMCSCVCVTLQHTDITQS